MRLRARLIGLLVTAGIGILIFVLQSGEPSLWERPESIGEAAHRTGPIKYDGTPPSTGDHHPMWWDCGVYDQPIPYEHAVHSLEHGAVWITYLPEVDPTELSQLTELIRGPYLLLSPIPGQRAPYIATAWGVQDVHRKLDVAALRLFIRTYSAGSNAPEPEATCANGTRKDLVRRK